MLILTGTSLKPIGSHCLYEIQSSLSVSKNYLLSQSWNLALALALKTIRSKCEFSSVAPIQFPQKWWGEADKTSSKFIMSVILMTTLFYIKALILQGKI